jgi:DNA repair protein RadC
MMQNAKKETPHHVGHRDRLRQRFYESGPIALADYELLELVLFLAIPQRDVKPLAKNLIAKFGGLTGVMNAPFEELVKIDGIKDNTAIAIKSITALSHRAMKGDVIKKPVLKTWDQLIDYCKATMAHETREHFRIIFMNKRNEIIADEIQTSGTIDHIAVYPREVIKRALELGSSSLILMHNHPSGDTKASRDDIDMTHAIIRAAEPFGIKIHDHIIITRGSYTSFKSQGLL